jgi:hypothetical protein
MAYTYLTSNDADKNKLPGSQQQQPLATQMKTIAVLCLFHSQQR